MKTKQKKLKECRLKMLVAHGSEALRRGGVRAIATGILGDDTDVAARCPGGGCCAVTLFAVGRAGGSSD